MSIYNQNEKRKGKLLSHSYISPQNYIHKENEEDEKDNCFEQKKNKDTKPQLKIEFGKDKPMFPQK